MKPEKFVVGNYCNHNKYVGLLQICQACLCSAHREPLINALQTLPSKDFDLYV